MLDNTFKAIFLIGWAVYEVLFAVRARQTRQNRIVDRRIRGPEAIAPLLAFIGMQVLPLFYVFTPWLDFANYHLPTWAGWAGAALFAVALWLTWRAHADLGRNWSPALEIKEVHALVTQGIYRYIRHPIYLGQWLWGIAQALLLQNGIAGLAGLATFALVYFERVPREEQMMLEHFGEEYRAYMDRTGRIIPRL